MTVWPSCCKSQSQLNNYHLYSRDFFFILPVVSLVFAHSRCSGPRRIIQISVFGWMLSLTSCHWGRDDIMDAVPSSEPCSLCFEKRPLLFRIFSNMIGINFTLVARNDDDDDGDEHEKIKTCLTYHYQILVFILLIWGKLEEICEILRTIKTHW